MKYYISISAWNLLESFTTESISPVAFYSERKYGAKLSRFLEDKFDRTYKLVLSTKDNGGNYTIVVDEGLVDKSLLVPEKDKTIFSYPKTIYFQKGLIAFRFNSQEIMDSLIAESQILFEVKCVGKYLSDFYVKEVKTTTIKTGKIGNLLSFDFMNYVEHDNRYNFIKGAITGFARGIMTAQSNDSRALQSKVMELKNAFAGLNTITLMGYGEIRNAGKYTSMIEECKRMYYSQRVEPTRIFDIMKQQFSEITKLAEIRANTISNKDQSYDQNMINSEIMSVRNRIFAIEEANNIGILISELEAIKKAERENGIKVGKERVYFKVDTPEYERKQEIKRLLNDFTKGNEEYKQLKDELQKLYARQSNNSNGQEILEGAIQAIFTRLSDLSNEIIKKISATECRNDLDLSPINISNRIEVASSYGLPEELSFFNMLLNVILDNPLDSPISDNAILRLVEKGTQAFIELPESATEDGKAIVNCMRGFWLYKNHRAASFDIPSNMEVIKSTMGFLLKPFGFDQIERYLLNKKCQHKEYAFMLWGACIGFADMPKTFTEVLYSDVIEAEKLDCFTRNNIEKLL